MWLEKIGKKFLNIPISGQLKNVHILLFRKSFMLKCSVLVNLFRKNKSFRNYFLLKLRQHTLLNAQPSASCSMKGWELPGCGGEWVVHMLSEFDWSTRCLFTLPWVLHYVLKSSCYGNGNGKWTFESVGLRPSPSQNNPAWHENPEVQIRILRMLSRSLFNCKSLTLNVTIQVSQLVSSSQLRH